MHSISGMHNEETRFGEFNTHNTYWRRINYHEIDRNTWIVTGKTIYRTRKDIKMSPDRL